MDKLQNTFQNGLIYIGYLIPKNISNWKDIDKSGCELFFASNQFDVIL